MTNTAKNRRLRIGTRGSKMARVQTDLFASMLAAKFPGTIYDIVPITVSGERDYARPIAELGIQGAFIKELEEALLNDEVDLVVHSLKDLPTSLPSNLLLACVCERKDPRDVLISKNNLTFADLPEGSRIGTSSRRREAQLKVLRPDLVFMDIRGNVPTRLNKLDEGYCDGLILAAAGMIRLGLTDRVAEYFDLEISLPVPGQGALGIECRSNDKEVMVKLEALDDLRTRFEITAERAFLAEVGGGCSMPIGALGRLGGLSRDPRLCDLALSACIVSLDGRRVVKGKMCAPATEAEELGVKLACHLLDAGGLGIVEELRALTPIAVSLP
jgi:hydroxymethylbilane synthase